MDCIPYISDLKVEINILKDLKKNNIGDNSKINEQIKEKELLISKCKENLSMLSINSIEYRLYLKILNGARPSKAVEEIASENYINNIKPSSVNKIWINYYKKIKKFL